MEYLHSLEEEIAMRQQIFAAETRAVITNRRTEGATHETCELVEHPACHFNKS